MSVGGGGGGLVNPTGRARVNISEHISISVLFSIISVSCFLHLALTDPGLRF